MEKTTYKDAHAGIKGTIHVYVGGRRAGTIIPWQGKWKYAPLGQPIGKQEPHDSLAALKSVLEAE